MGKVTTGDHPDLKMVNPSAAAIDIGSTMHMAAVNRLCCTNPMRDSSRESSVVAGLHEQTHIPRLQDQELARI
jgi:hypothetical protein